MSENTTPWNGSEPIADALDRFGYHELFDSCLAVGKLDDAVRLLLACGVDDVKANRIVQLTLRSSKSGEN
jgi:hypothetical protein